MEEDSLVDCTKVFIKNVEGKGASTFAKQDIRQGELVEYGIMRRLENFDGNKSPYVFCWSDDIPNHTWAFSTGCAAFYNTSLTPNTSMTRFFDEDRFEIHALVDIKKGDELFHKYKSLAWRECWDELREIVKKDQGSASSASSEVDETA